MTRGLRKPVDVAERIFAAALKSLDECKPGQRQDLQGEIAAGAIRTAVFCLDQLVHETGRVDDAARHRARARRRSRPWHRRTAAGGRLPASPRTRRRTRDSSTRLPRSCSDSFAARVGELVERPAVIDQHRGAAGKPRPALDDDVDKGRRQLHSIAPSAFLFGRDKGGARARERLVNQLARLVRSRLGPRQQAHCSSPAKKWSPGHQPLLVLPRKLVQTTGTVAELFRRVDAL